MCDFYLLLRLTYWLALDSTDGEEQISMFEFRNREKANALSHSSLNRSKGAKGRNVPASARPTKKCDA